MPTQDIQYALDSFPKLAVDGWHKTSEETTDYNCFAFALHDEDDWYSPLPISGYYWPADKIAMNTSIPTMVDLYRYEGGFEPCENGEYEEGFEKIALYINQRGNVTHAARQISRSMWTSKLGTMIDIEHRLLSSLEDAGITDDEYGKVAQFLKRPFQLKPVLGFYSALALPAPRNP
jgi:hypothetical protein